MFSHNDTQVIQYAMIAILPWALDYPTVQKAYDAYDSLRYYPTDEQIENVNIKLNCITLPKDSTVTDLITVLDKHITIAAMGAQAVGDVLNGSILLLTDPQHGYITMEGVNYEINEEGLTRTICDSSLSLRFNDKESINARY